MKQKNIYTKMILLKDVKDDKELFTLQERNGATLYNCQTNTGNGILITSKNILPFTFDKIIYPRCFTLSGMPYN